MHTFKTLDVKQYMCSPTGVPIVMKHEYYVEHSIKGCSIEIKEHFGVEG